MNLTPDYSPDGQPARRQDQLAAIALTAREPDGRSEHLTAGVASLHRHPTLGRYRPQDGTLGVLQPDAEDPLGEVDWIGEVVIGRHRIAPQATNPLALRPSEVLWWMECDFVLDLPQEL